MRKLLSGFSLAMVAIFIMATYNITYAGLPGKTNPVLSKPAKVDLRRFNPNRIATDVLNEGQWVSWFRTGNAGMEWPAGSGKTIHFAAGIWIAGMVNGQVRSAAAEFSVEFVPGPILPDGSIDPDNERYRNYIISKADLEAATDDDPNTTPGTDYQQWPSDLGAPLDKDGNPLVIGNGALWNVFNDADVTAHANLWNTQPIGVEVQQYIWGFNRLDAFGDMLFLKWTIINKGGNNLDSAFVSLWNDFDLGDATDDFVGVDTTLSLGIGYNDGADRVYGARAPAIGLDFFQGPIVPSEGDTAFVSGRLVPGFKNLPMTAFAKYINGGGLEWGDPESAEEAYNYMNGLNRAGKPYVDPHTGTTLKFAHPGDPVTGTGWLDKDNHPSGDRRFLMTTGPFTLANADTQEVVAGFMIAQASNSLQSVALLRQVDKAAQTAYDRNFELPPSPPAPKVTATELDGEIVLTWDDAAESYDVPDLVGRQKFQGYNVYQVGGPQLTGDVPIERLAFYDVADGQFDDVRDVVFDPNLGVVEKVVQPLGDTGIRRFYRTKTDAINKRPLINGRKYWFAVTSFAYNPDGFTPAGVPKILESSIKILEVIPQSPPLGERYARAAGDTLAVTHTGKSDGKVYPIVLDPSALTGQDYKVTFRTDEQGEIVWDLLAGGQAKVSGWTNQSASDAFNFPIVDGMLVQVFGPPVGIKSVDRSVGPEDGGPGGTRWISGTNWGGAFLFGGLDIGANFFGSTLGPADYVPVDWRFTSNPTMSEETGWSRAYVYRRDQGYAFQTSQLGWIPVQMFDITDPNNPRRLNIVFVEDANDGLADFIWNPIAAEQASGKSLGGREYLFCMKSDYNPDGGVYDDNNWGPAADVLYALWPHSRGSHPYQESDFWIRIIPNFANTPQDEFTFTAPAPTISQTLAKQDAAEMVNVFPNPYYGRNVEETDPVNRFITFTHLPETATIRVFTLAGKLVKTIEHKSTQFEKWDLRNDAGIPVASGIYIVHIDMGALGQKILKVAVFMPEERLDAI
ncbi:MAG: T9SS C-terminal target domain-containing protein [Calditrichaeota bacterium]|nr:MAG: T9SS C-terminal target domain-containing protein [Calditrichota bacterium]